MNEEHTRPYCSLYNPRLSLPVQSSNREKLAEERGLFDGGVEYWRDVVRSHTYLFIKITDIQALVQTLTDICKILKLLSQMNIYANSH